MNIAEYIIQSLVELGVSELFGIPGGIILELLYAADSNSKMSVHLSNHEQASGYSALGYAQASGKLGVAYSTRGPGFTNLLTPIADAYFDSIPVLFITAHKKKIQDNCRFIEEQEFDIINVVKKITKYVDRVDDIENALMSFEVALQAALSGRPGPVVLDFNERLFTQELPIGYNREEKFFSNNLKTDFIVKDIETALIRSNKPILLLGNGIHQRGVEQDIQTLASKLCIPVISSCISLDILNSFPNYYGYIGSHGIRLANYIIHECDLIISLGNRLIFDKFSATFGKISQKKIIRIDCDELEERNFINESFYSIDLKELVPVLNSKLTFTYNCKAWTNTCDKLSEILSKYEESILSDKIHRIIQSYKGLYFVCDVGNHQFLITQAFYLNKVSCRLLQSKSFAAVGCSIPKAIGVYHHTKEKVIAFCGDQGFLFNIQELIYIKHWNLPIKIFIINNFSSGMIRDRQLSQNRGVFLHTTAESGYIVPMIENLSRGFEIRYRNFDFLTNSELDDILADKYPCIIEIQIPDNVQIPSIPKGVSMNDFSKIVSELDMLKIGSIIGEQ